MLNAAAKSKQLPSTHPVDVHVAFWNDMGVKKGRLSCCGEAER